MNTLEQSVAQLKFRDSGELKEKVHLFIQESRLLSNTLKGFTMDGRIAQGHKRENDAFFSGIAQLCHLVELIFQRPDFQQVHMRTWLLDMIADEFDQSPAKWFIVAKLSTLLAARSGNPEGTPAEYAHPSEFSKKFRDDMRRIFASQPSEREV